jgi:hypothetical protein
MKSTAVPHRPVRCVPIIFLVLALCCPSGSVFAGQGPAQKNVSEQREAMRKLSFLSGRWSGPATIAVGPGRTLDLTQTENVQYKLDGLVLLVEGKGTNTDGKTVFRSLATIAYDNSSHTYRFRAYNDGHYVDTQLLFVPGGFSWDFTAGPAHVINTMRLTGKGQWHELTQTAFGSGPPQTSLEMTLSRLR